MEYGLNRMWNGRIELPHIHSLSLSPYTDEILRVFQIVSKYITDPVLFQRDDLVGGVKFDIRYVLLLTSVNPTVLHAYNVFWLRFANR